MVRIHVGITAIPPLIALVALIYSSDDGIVGPLRLDSLAWLMATFILTIGLIVQRFSIRYLFGDQSYRKYFALLTITTSAAAVTWQSDDLRLLLACWAVTLLGLSMLIGLNQKWQVAKHVSIMSGRMLAVSWIVLLLAVIWLFQVTGHWQLSLALSEYNVEQMSWWEKTGINLLLVLGVIIPAAQWPFQRWLLESVVSPTPISAVMHAGVVNAGGVLLTLFAPIFHGNIASFILICVASFSVLLGTGIIFVQVDYKRQLVASTIAQMGFMLIQCGLGAYIAAITHLILHGFFKAALFLQVGSAVEKVPIASSEKRNQPSLLWKLTGGGFGLLVGGTYFLTAHQDGYQLISSLIIGCSVWLAWTPLIALSKGVIGKVVGFTLMGAVGMVFIFIHSLLDGLLSTVIYPADETFLFNLVFVVFILLFGWGIAGWFTRHRSSSLAVKLYIWLVRFGEPHPKAVESHPKYLSRFYFRVGDES